MKRLISFVMLLAVVAMFMVACATPEQRAQKLFDEGKYEEVVAKFPNLPIAKNAKAKIAEKMCEEGKYEEVLAAYGETPSAMVARNMLAEKLYEEEKYEELCNRYPRTPAAKKAENILADKLYEDGKLDDVIERYPNSVSGMKAKNELGAKAYEATKRMKKTEKEMALREIIKKYGGSEAARMAQQDLAEIGRKSKKAQAVQKRQ
jgi:TolA-binding protein